MKTEQGRPRLPLRKFLADFESGSRPRGGVGGILTGIPSLGGEHLNRDGGFKFEKIKFVPRAFAKAMTRGHLKPGDVLVVKDGATTGKVSLVRSDFPYQDAVINEHVFRLQLKEEYQPAYVFYFLYSQIGQQQILSDFRGAAQGGISQGFVDKVFVPVVTLDEQQKIVEEIEKQFTRLEAGVSALKRVQANLNRYRAAVLKAACEGKLVPTEAELAKKEKRKYETGEALLARILTERRTKWEEDQLSRFEADGRTPKNDKWKARYKEPDTPDISALPVLPEGWVWVEVDQLAWSVKDGPHYSPKYATDGVPFISGGNIRPSGVDFDNVKRITPELHAELSKRCKPEVGDILYTKGGTTGIARVNTYTEEFNVWVHVAVLKLVDSVNRFYIQHTLNSPFCYAQAQKFTHGVGNQDLGLTRMIHISLALPPLAEQTRIVAEVERRLSVIDELEGVVKLNLDRATRLRQAILQKAFSGNLI